MSDPSKPILTISDYRAAYQVACATAHPENRDSSSRSSLTARQQLLWLWEKLDASGVGPEGDTAWIYLPTQEQRQALLCALEEKDPAQCPLWGVPFAVKDNIDIAHWPTTAACPEYAYTATAHSTAVAALINAGAIPVGKTNLDQFATGLVGTRSPYGWVRNTFSAQHVSGGSSSGSASVVARGLVCFALGTDTAGSGRIPAGFNNLVGTKPTPGLVSIEGVVPACRTLDCVSIMSLTAADASTVLNVLSDYSALYADKEPRFHSPALRPKFAFPEALRVGVPAKLVFTDPQYEQCFDDALERLRQWNVELVPIDMTALDAIARKLYTGPWVAERYLTARDTILENAPGLDPTVKSIISAGAGYSAADTFEALYDARSQGINAASIWNEIDVLLVPTAPGLPTYQALVDDPVGANSALGCYTNFVNLLGWAAVATPAGLTREGLPFGVTWIAPAGTDHALLGLAQRWLSLQKRPLGCHLTDHYDETCQSLQRPAQSHPIAVVGAHLSGMPLNGQLQAAGARLAQVSTTSQSYRLFAIPNTHPPKPGLVRVDEGGQTIALEVYDVPAWAVSDFLKGIAAPLGLGNVELSSGQWVTGFICEPAALKGARDITEFGGWRAYMQVMAAAKETDRTRETEA